MPTLHQVSRRLYRIAFKLLRTRREIERLRACEAVEAKLLAQVFQAVMADEKSVEESTWIAKIESLRDELNGDETEVTVQDYGAVTPDSDRNDEEMYLGKSVVRTVSSTCRDASKPYLWALLLFKLVRAFRPNVCLELGTCLGISTSYQAASLALNGNGRMISLEGAPSLAAIARSNLERLGLTQVQVTVGRFQDTLNDVLHSAAPIDFVFIDGHHDENATLDYFQRICPHLSESSILVFDDISWSAGMKNAWRTIIADHRMTLTADLFSMGICLVSKSLKKADRNFTIALC